MVRRGWWFIAVLVSVAGTSLALPEPLALAADPSVRIDVREVQCERDIGKVRVGWSVYNLTPVEAFYVGESLTPAGAVTYLRQQVFYAVDSGNGPSWFESKAPVGAASMTLTVTIGWLDGSQATASATATFSDQCGNSRPWAALTDICNGSIRVDLGNRADAIGAVRLHVRRVFTQEIAASRLLLPGQDTSLAVYQPAQNGPIEVIVDPLARIADFFGPVNNWSGIPRDCPPGENPAPAPYPPVAPPPTVSGGGGSAGTAGGGSAGGGSGVVDPADPATTAVTTPHPTPSAATSEPAGRPSTAAVDEVSRTSETRASGLFVIWVLVVLGVLGGLAGGAFWLRRRRVEAPPGNWPCRRASKLSIFERR